MDIFYLTPNNINIVMCQWEHCFNVRIKCDNGDAVLWSGDTNQLQYCFTHCSHRFALH